MSLPDLQNRPTPDWSPFLVSPKPVAPRSINTAEGVADRLRAAAFAEIQAREAFSWASKYFTDAPEPLRQAWAELALAEERHLGWLLKRMEELKVDVREKTVSDHLWHSLMACQNARDFAFYIANAEERGRRAGVRFRDAMKSHDPVSAEIFGKIADEEVEHIELAARHYPEGQWGPQLAASLQ